MAARKKKATKKKATKKKVARKKKATKKRASRDGSRVVATRRRRDNSGAWREDLPAIRAAGCSWRECAERLGVNKDAIYKARRKARAAAADEKHPEHDWAVQWLEDLDGAEEILLDDLEDATYRRATHGTKVLKLHEGEPVTAQRWMVEGWTDEEVSARPMEALQPIMVYEVKHHDSLAMFHLRNRRAAKFNLKVGTDRVDGAGDLDVGTFLVKVGEAIAQTTGMPMIELTAEELEAQGGEQAA